MHYLNACDGAHKYTMRSEPGRGAGRRVRQLIWGDRLHLTGRTEDRHAEVHARGDSRAGWVPETYITETGLLEFYVIDVGQGDGILIRTPDNHWHLIDAGIANERQDTGKGAANFVRWKFNRDLREPARLSTLIMSHPDYDHYGGMLNLLSGNLADGGRPFNIAVDTFYHTGMGRFDSGAALGETRSGEVDRMPYGGYRIRRRGSFITELLSDKGSFENPTRAFKGAFAKLAELVGEKVGTAVRLACPGGDETWLPGYAPADGITGADGTRLSVRVLAPVLETFTDSSGRRHHGLRKLTSQSKTRNGHSITLRFDYGDARILMSGDLNAESQRLLLSYTDAREFESDAVKGCHHGSEDIDMRFIKCMRGGATVISSGDNESYAHPRPVVLGASGFYGREIRTPDGDTLPPLVYSTELSRSAKLEHADRVRIDDDDDGSTRDPHYRANLAEVRPQGGSYRNLAASPIVTDLIYGLVNIRTDGRTLMLATMKESGDEFDIKTFLAGSV